MICFAKSTRDRSKVLFLAKLASTQSINIQHPLPLQSRYRVSHFINLFPKIKVTLFKDLTNWHLKYFWDLGGVNTKDYFILVSCSYPRRSSFMCNIWQTNIVTALIFKRKYSQLNAESIWRFSLMIYSKKSWKAMNTFSLQTAAFKATELKLTRLQNMTYHYLRFHQQRSN